MIAGIILVAELVVRAALIYIVVALAPLVFAAQLWPALRGIGRKLLELLVALILSKLVIAVALAVAAAAMVGTGSGGEVTALPPPEIVAEDPGGSVTQAVGILLAAMAAFGVSAFSPMLVTELMPMTEAAVVAAGIKGAPVRAGQQALSVGSYAAHRPRLDASDGTRFGRRRPARCRGRGWWLRRGSGPGRRRGSRRVHGSLPPPARAHRQRRAWPPAPPIARRGGGPRRRRRNRRHHDRRPAMATERDGRAYRFDPADSSGIFLGLGAIQCALLGGGLLCAVGALTAGLPLAVAAGPVAGAVVASFARLGSHPIWEWLPLGTAG